jgi:hypothetical protein
MLSQYVLPNTFIRFYSNMSITFSVRMSSQQFWALPMRIGSIYSCTIWNSFLGSCKKPVSVVKHHPKLLLMQCFAHSCCSWRLHIMFRFSLLSGIPVNEGEFQDLSALIDNQRHKWSGFTFVSLPSVLCVATISFGFSKHVCIRGNNLGYMWLHHFLGVSAHPRMKPIVICDNTQYCHVVFSMPH